MGEDLRVEVRVVSAFGMTASDAVEEGLSPLGEDYRDAGLLSAEHYYIIRTNECQER